MVCVRIVNNTNLFTMRRWSPSTGCTEAGCEVHHHESGVDGFLVSLQDKKRIVEGFWRGEISCVDPKAKDADLWMLIWEEMHRVHQEAILVEVEHVKAHRIKEKQHISLFEKSITEGNEKADDLAKDRAMMDGEVAQTRASTVRAVAIHSQFPLSGERMRRR